MWTCFLFFFQDLVVIGGDLVDGPVNRLEKAVEPLEWINPSYGTYYVTGITKDEYKCVFLSYDILSGSDITEPSE